MFPELETENLCAGSWNARLFSLNGTIPVTAYAKLLHNDASGSVAEVELIHPITYNTFVVAPPVNPIFPHTSQSPGVKVIDVKSAGVTVVRVTGADASTTLDRNCPTLPEAALLFVVVPIIPVVDVNVRLVADAAPSAGVTNVGELLPTKLPVPVLPESPTFTEFTVAILTP